MDICFKAVKMKAHNSKKTKRVAGQLSPELLQEAADFKYAIEKSSILVVTDPHGNIRTANQNWEKISHFNVDELENQTLNIVQEEFYAKEFIRSIWESVADGNIWQGELKFRTKDGSIYWGDTSIVPILKEGAVNKYVVIKKDITAYKLTEEELQLAREKLRLHVENTPLGFIEWDAELNVRTLSERAREIFGWNRGERTLNGATDYGRLFENMQPWVSELKEQLHRDEVKGHSTLHQNMTSDGRTITCEWFNSVVKDRDGHIVTIVSMVHDLTAKMETEAQLRESEEFNCGVLNALNSHVAVLNADGLITAVNASWDQFAKQYDSSLVQATGVGSNYFSVCEQAAKRGDELSAQALRGMKDILNGKEKDMYVEYPCNSPTGKRWFGMRALKFEMNEPMLVVAHQDISELKLVEENLLYTRQQLTAAEHMARMGNWSLNPMGDHIYWSEGMYAIFGLPAGSELTPESSLQPIHPDDREVTMAQLLENRTCGEELTVSFRVIRPDTGEERTLQCTSDTEKNEKGEVVRLFGIAEDVTEMKSAQSRSLVRSNTQGIRATELMAINVKLIATNRELEQAQSELDKTLRGLEQRVEERTAQLAAKNRHVMDSINYAQRIQTGLLPSVSQLTKLFRRSFILNRPCNTVSGDFFWVHKSHNRKFIVVADCTGHGVPGALMSIICNNLLNQIIIEENVDNPSIILEQLDIRLKRAVKGDHEEVQDGMDLVLCIVDGSYSELYYAGAYRPLFITDAEGRVQELKPDRQAIGGRGDERRKEFITKRSPIIPKQRIYLTSDGYYSQFGGPNDKKFMKSRFKDLLESIQSHAMAEQKKLLRETLTAWTGINEQVDDVLVVGIEL